LRDPQTGQPSAQVRAIAQALLTVSEANDQKVTPLEAEAAALATLMTTTARTPASPVSHPLPSARRLRWQSRGSYAIAAISFGSMFWMASEWMVLLAGLVALVGTIGGALFLGEAIDARQEEATHSHRSGLAP
jgi:hypothetical protein